VQLSESLTTATVSLLDALDEKQTDHALFPFDETERRSWYYWPAERRGMALWELDRSQTKAVHRLLATVLPVPAFARTVTIMGLDEVLDRLEHHAGDRRHRDDYWLSIFGEPGDESWGLRFEGHHVSVHVTVRVRRMIRPGNSRSAIMTVRMCTWLRRTRAGNSSSPTMRGST